MERLQTFLVELGLLVGAVVCVFIVIAALVNVRNYRRIAGGRVRATVSDITGTPIPANRWARAMEADLAKLGFTRLGVMGATWPWSPRPWPIRLYQSEDRRVVAQTIDMAGETRVLFESRLDDDFVLITAFPETLRHAGATIDHVGTMTSPAQALDEHLARIEAAAADHGQAQPMGELEEVLERAAATPGVGGPEYRRTVLRPGMRTTFVVGGVFLALAFVFTFQLLRVVDSASFHAPSVTWTAIGPLPGTEPAVVHALTWTPSGFVAVGQVGSSFGSAGAAWISADGLTWQLEVADPGPDPQPVDPADPREVAIFAVANHVSDLVGVGLVQSMLGEPVARVWTSSGGTPWEAVDDVSGLDGTPFYLAWDGDRLVATGQTDPPPESQDPGTIGMIWTSTDGKAWERATFPAADLLDSVVHGSGGFVAISVRGVLDPTPSYTALLHSLDGVTWSEAVVDSSSGSERFDDVIALDHGYLAVAEGGRVWRSDDGAIWRRVAVDASTFRAARFSSVDIGPAGIAAIGDVGTILDATPVVWLSPDGRRWADVGDPRAGVRFSAFHVAVGTDAVVTFGLSEQGSSGSVGRFDQP